jgi:hypothetical protein
MIWLALLKRFWLPLTVAVALIGGVAYFGHTRYESGYAASEAKWQPAFDAAERELAAANDRTRMKESQSTRSAEDSQRRIDETRKTLLARTADYDSRLRALSMRLAAATASSRDVPTPSRGAASPDAATESSQRAAEVGSRIGGIGADCESDAARLAEWQRFYTEQRDILNR